MLLKRKRKKRPPLAEASRFGFGCKLVLSKIGFDLRRHYGDVLREPLPDEWKRTVEVLRNDDAAPESERVVWLNSHRKRQGTDGV